jgi:hypothetical protein
MPRPGIGRQSAAAPPAGQLELQDLGDAAGGLQGEVALPLDEPADLLTVDAGELAQRVERQPAPLDGPHELVRKARLILRLGS